MSSLKITNRAFKNTKQNTQQVKKLWTLCIWTRRNPMFAREAAIHLHLDQFRNCHRFLLSYLFVALLKAICRKFAFCFVSSCPNCVCMRACVCVFIDLTMSANSCWTWWDNINCCRIVHWPVSAEAPLLVCLCAQSETPDGLRKLIRE